MTAPALTLAAIEDSLVALFDTLEGMDAADPLRPDLERDIAQMIFAEVRKVDGVTKAMATLENRAAFAAAEIKRLQGRKQAAERGLERLEQYVQRIMEDAHLPKLEGRTSTLSLQANPPSVIITDMNAIPAEFRTIVPETFTVSKSELAKVLKKGFAIAGAELSEGNMRLVRK